MQIRKSVLKEVGKLIRKDMKQACMIKTPSLLRGGSMKDLSTFSWDTLLQELMKSAPIFVQLLTNCVSRKRRKAYCLAIEA